jgi:hypothetical protein
MTMLIEWTTMPDKGKKQAFLTNTQAILKKTGQI